MKKIYAPHYLTGVYLSLCIVIYSCSQEEVFDKVEYDKELSQDIRLPAFDTLIQNSYTIHWDDTITNEEPLTNTARTSNSPKELVEFPITSEGYLTLEDEINSRSIVFSILAEKTDDGLKDTTLLKFLPFDSSVNVINVSYLKMDDFTGTVYKYDAQGHLTAVEGFFKGVLQATLSDTVPSDSSARLQDMNPEPCTDCSPWEQGMFMEITVFKYTDWYVSVGGGSYNYGGSDYNGSYTYQVWVPDTHPEPSKSQHEHQPGNATGSTTTSHPRDVITSSVFKSSRAGCVYNKIGGGYRFQNLIKDYQNNGGTVNLTFTVGQTKNNVNGEARPTNSSYTDVTIIIDVDYLASSARTIEVARTLYHEAIHAKIFSYLRQIGGYNSLDPNNFPSLYNAYVDRVSTGKINTAGSNAQHDYMAQRYIDLIAKGVQQFDVRNHNNPEITLDHYRALAWAGLQGSRAWNNKSEPERKAIDQKRIFLVASFGAINCN